MLRWLGLELASRRDVRHQRQVNINGAAARQIIAELANCLQKRHGFNIADRATDFTKNEIILLITFDNEVLDLVRDVRNHLNSRAEIISPAFLFDDIPVDTSGRNIVLLVGRTSCKALIVTKIKVSFSAIVGHKDLAVLIRRHRARIDVEIGVELADPHAVSTSLQECRQSGCSDAFSEGRNHAASDENISGHGLISLVLCE